ncbi:MAG: protein disulfide isomerase family protein [Nanoarchaeota archaeon]|nr:hypothetical protein [Nanoarchaeota archaeon]MBU1632665.1 hypothetical protein [Nanoarchaeota archaeon]MBU1875575.1 hypothetical protein [Nanoarchaeota archaeon]
MKYIEVLIFLSSLITILFIVGCSGNSIQSIDSFASCLKEKGAKMYGADWCGHCNAQKEMFGSSFAEIDYTECTVEMQKCDNEGIQGYPTWKFADGSSLAGIQKFVTLAGKTGCSLP